MAHHRARRHCPSAREYIERHDQKAAARVIAAIRGAVQQIASSPHLGRPGRVERTRELVIPHTPYIVAYTVVGGQMVILAILHGAEEWPEGFD